MSNDDNTIDASASGADLPPAARYPDPHDAAVQRYWDGAQWTAHTAPAAAEAAAPTAPVSAVPLTAPSTASTVPASLTISPAGGGAITASPRRRNPRLKWWQWALIAVAAIVLLSIIVNGLSGRRADDAADDDPAKIAETAEVMPAEEPEPIDDRAKIPALIGLSVAEARAALEAAGFVIATPDGTGDDWTLATQTLSEGRKADAGTEVLVTAEAPKPVYTLAQENATAKAKSCLSFSGFSRTGLIGQLEFEDFSTEDETFGADNAGADWNAEAAEKAASYLEYTSFSRQGLYDQLAFEGFTDSEIQFGLAAMGY